MNRPVPPQRLPMLTEVIEFEGEAMRVCPIAAVGPDGHEPAAAPASDPAGAPAAGPSSDLAANAPTAAADGLPVDAAPELAALDAALHAELRAALAPLFEQMLQQAVETACASIAWRLAERRGSANPAHSLRPPLPNTDPEFSP